MCGRLNLYDSALIRTMMSSLGLPLFPDKGPRYNLPPASTLTVIMNPQELAEMEWSIEFRQFRHPNTKVDTLKRKPFLKKLLLEQRILYPVNRFYEWPDPKVRPKYLGNKTRFCIRTPDDVMFLAGIFKVNPDGVPQFNILTTEPTPAIDDFHHRSPVIIAPTDVMTWLTSHDQDELYQLMNPYKGELILYECDAYVDNGRHEGPRCMQPKQ